MEYSNSKHLISKNFYCAKCSQNFTRLVFFTTIKTICPKCNTDNCPEVCNLKTSSLALRQKLLSKISPFTISPFKASITRSHNNFDDIFDEEEDELAFNTSKDDFFIDNFNSNFISNFNNPMHRIVFIQSQKNNNDSSPPLNKKYLYKLRNLKIGENICKKINENTYEFPNCFICLKDIFIGNDAILLRCGHLFHKDCILEWLEIHSVCSICKFDAVKKNEHKSSIDKAYEQEIEEFNMARKRSRTHRNSIDKDNNNNLYNIDDINSIEKVLIANNIDLHKSNINIIGESEGILL